MRALSSLRSQQQSLASLAPGSNRNSADIDPTLCRCDLHAACDNGPAAQPLLRCALSGMLLVGDL